MFERREQIRTQALLLLANGIQIPSLKQERKKTLREIFCLLRFGALSSHEGINRSPVSATKFLQRSLCCWAWALRSQHHAPMGCIKCNRSFLSLFIYRSPRSPVVNCQHTAIQVKSRMRSKLCREIPNVFCR